MYLYTVLLIIFSLSFFFGGVGAYVEVPLFYKRSVEPFSLTVFQQVVFFPMNL